VFGGGDVGVDRGQLVDVELARVRVAAERQSRTRAREMFGARRVLEVPAASEEPRGRAALLRLARSVRRALPLQKERAPKVFPTTSARGVALPIAPTVRLVLFGGKGGVGKTTAAAASALSMPTLPRAMTQECRTVGCGSSFIARTSSPADGRALLPILPRALAENIRTL
jgi:hypothetical protein